MRDVLVRAIAVRLVDAIDAVVGDGGLLFFLEHFRERPAGALAQGFEARIAADARCEVRPIGFAQGADQRVAALLADFAVEIAAAVVQADIAVFLGHDKPPYAFRLLKMAAINVKTPTTVVSARRILDSGRAGNDV
jgi:hypothetical protein